MTKPVSYYLRLLTSLTASCLLATACGGGLDPLADAPEQLAARKAYGNGNGNGKNAAPVTEPAPAPAPVPLVGTATLTWGAPQTNADGSTLTDLAGFRIYYGTASGNYSQAIAVSSSTLTYTIENLSAGTYYVIIKAYDTSNNESLASAEVSKTIQ